MIKSYRKMTQSLNSPAELAYSDDMAVTTFRSFHNLGAAHCERVVSAQARQVMLEVLEDLQNVLAKNRNVV